MSRRLRYFGATFSALAVLSFGFWALAVRTPPAPLPGLRGTLLRDSITVGGRQRSFQYYLPPVLPPDPRLVLVLHGSGMDGAQIRKLTGYSFDVLADREPAIIAYPNGWDRNWNDCRAGGDFEARELGVDDVAFIRMLVVWFARERNVPSDAVFVAGMSNGGQLAYRLALEAPDLVRAIAVIAAGMPAAADTRCAAAGKPVPAIIINGTDDPLNPYEGGQVALWGFLHRRGHVESSLASARYWAELAGHHGEPASEPIRDTDPADGTTATRLTWSGAAGPKVVLVSVRGGGHAVPHPTMSLPRLFGRTSHDFSAAEEVWHFFGAPGATSRD